MNSTRGLACHRTGGRVGCLGVATDWGSDYVESSVLATGGQEGLYQDRETDRDTYSYSGSLGTSSWNGSGSYTQHNTYGYSGDHISSERYNPSGPVASQSAYNEVETSTTSSNRVGSTSYHDPMYHRYTTSDTTSQASTNYEWHNTSASGPNGST